MQMASHRTFVKPHEVHVKYCQTEVYKVRKVLTPFFSFFLSFLSFSVYVYLNEVSMRDQWVCYPEEVQKCVVNMTDGV